MALSITEFGRELFRSKDLDPIYVALLDSKFEERQLKRWLIAYWLFYHAGFASWVSELEGKAFWAKLVVAAANVCPAPTGSRWPRGSERRYFRGVPAERAVDGLRNQFHKPEVMVDALLDGPMNIRAVVDRVKTLPMFGSWIAFKVADMIDGVLQTRIDQDDLTVFLYDTPRKSIEVFYENNPIEPKGDRFEYAMAWLWFELKDCRIPHKPDSAPDWFSLETVWCKHHSHLTGHYPLYKDIAEIRHGLAPWCAVSATAKKFKSNLPKRPHEPLPLW